VVQSTVKIIFRDGFFKQDEQEGLEPSAAV
jgi:hypothetical protein